MWPIWLIGAIAGGAVFLTITSAVLAVNIDRKRYRSAATQQNLDRTLSQRHRGHLSINDVDITNLPRPTRSLRHGLQQSCRDSRFYSIMPSEEEIKTFPDGTAESLAQTPYLVEEPGANPSHQWLSPSKPKKKDERKRKTVKLSLTAPMARPSLSAVAETTDPGRRGSPDPVELPTHATPKTTPQKPSDAYLPMAMGAISHMTQDSIDSIIGETHLKANRVSQRISHGNTLKSRSISMGSITAPPPDRPLPPVPESGVHNQNIGASVVRSKSEVSIHHTEMSVLNSSLSSHQDAAPTSPRLARRQLRNGNGLSGFDFGLQDNSMQLARVDAETRHDKAGEELSKLKCTKSLSFGDSGCAATHAEGDSLKTIDASKWNLPFGLRRLGVPTPTLSASSNAGSRPISAISLNRYSGIQGLGATPNRSPAKSAFDPPSRPVSMTSIDCFRNSVVGPDAPVLAPDSPKTKGHKRQNCVRISGLTPAETAKKRLSSQLYRLAEADETDGEDNKSVGIEIPTISPAKPLATVRTQQSGCGGTLPVPKLRQAQPSLPWTKQSSYQYYALDNETPSIISNAITTVQKPSRFPIEGDSAMLLSQPTTMAGHFMCQGSPVSDPTKPPLPKQEYSPVSPSAALTPKKKHSDPYFTYSPASPSMLDSANPSTVNSPSARTKVSPRRHKAQLHGPRNIPAPSLRTRNKTSPRVRQSERSGSPIRKSAVGVKQNQRSASQDDIRQSLALLKSLTHSARSSSALPEANFLKNSPGRPATNANQAQAAIAWTSGSRYSERPAASTGTIRRPRQRSRTVGAPEPPSMFDPPRLRPEVTYPPHSRLQRSETILPVNTRFSHSPSGISIWEDASVRGDSPELPSKSLESPPATTSAEFAMLPSTNQTKPSQQLEKDSLWNFQQNAGIFTSRTLALGACHAQNTSKSPKDKEKKVAKILHGHWDARGQNSNDRHNSQTQAASRLGSGSALNSASNSNKGPNLKGGIGGRQRSHTFCVNTSTKSVNAGDGEVFNPKTCEGVGLGVDFGRTGLATTFLNEMERDGIGRLR